MITLQEMLSYIDDAKKQRDIIHETSPANSALIKEKCGGRFEAVCTGIGNEKCLIPEECASFFLYRGQNEEYTPCVPSINRGKPSDEEIFIDRMRLVMFKHLIDSHPVVNGFFKKHHFIVDVEGLAQHYGIRTSVLDLTNNIEVALFFATCKYNSQTDEYECYDDDKEHRGILYIFDPLFDNEPTPPMHLNIFNGNIRPIGLQPFLRPAMQAGFALHIKKGCSTKSYLYEFTFTSADSKYYFEKFKQGEQIWIKDELIKKAKKIKTSQVFSFAIFNETYREFRPKVFSKTSLKRALANRGIQLKSKASSFVFDADETEAIKYEWNSHRGTWMAQHIIRRPWYEHDGIDEESGKVLGIHNRNNFRSLERLSQRFLLELMASPEAPQGAVWRNYTNTPTPKSHKRMETQWTKIPMYMEDVFGQTYLEEKDWKLE